jgi:hypothetical protein
VTAIRIASHHRTHDSAARGSALVSSQTVRAARAVCSRSSSLVRPTMPARISPPLPAPRPERSQTLLALAASLVAESGPGSIPVRAARVEIPMSVAPSFFQAMNRAAIWSRTCGSVRSAPVAAT